MKNPHDVIIKPLISEKTVKLSYGDERIMDEDALVRKYTFVVARDANKIEIKQALESIYNSGKKESDSINITSVRTVNVKGKTKRVGMRNPGKKPDWKKAIVTLAKGQMLEDYGV